MRRFFLLLALAACVGVVMAAGGAPSPQADTRQVELYRWVDLPVDAPGAATGLARWDVEGTCVWTHADGVTRRTSLVWYSGDGDTYVYRFGASLPGRWTGRTRSPAAALDGLTFTVEVTPSTNPERIGWSGQLPDDRTAWAHQRGAGGQLAKRTPILVMLPDVRRWHEDPAAMRALVAEFRDGHGFNGGHISTIGSSWFELGAGRRLRDVQPAPDVRTFAAIEAAASAWAERGGWLHLWMWGKGEGGDFSELPGGHDGAVSRRLNRYVAARLGPVPGWSMGIGWDVEFWADEAKLRWWLDDLIPQLGGWHHWIGFRYSDSDTGAADPDPANRGEYRSRGIRWNTLRPGSEQYAGWEHWAPLVTDAEIDAGLKAVPDRPMMSEDRFRRRDGADRAEKDMASDADILREVPRWASRGVAAIYGRMVEGAEREGSDLWPNRAEIKAVIARLEE